MDTSPRQIVLMLWRDAAIALLVLYFSLLTLDIGLNGFVAALLPLPAIGLTGLALLCGWLFATRSTKR